MYRDELRISKTPGSETMGNLLFSVTVVVCEPAYHTAFKNFIIILNLKTLILNLKYEVSGFNIFLCSILMVNIVHVL